VNRGGKTVKKSRGGKGGAVYERQAIWARREEVSRRGGWGLGKRVPTPYLGFAIKAKKDPVEGMAGRVGPGRGNLAHTTIVRPPKGGQKVEILPKKSGKEADQTGGTTKVAWDLVREDRGNRKKRGSSLDKQ